MLNARLPVLAVLTLASAAFAAAQSGQPAAQAAKPPSSTLFTSPYDSRTQIPAVSPTPLISVLPGGSPEARQIMPGVVTLTNPKLIARLTPSEGPCYTLRSYQFTPDTPGSGAGRITGQSSCQPAHSVHHKSIQATVSAAPK
jgi:hypothetical protein